MTRVRSRFIDRALVLSITLAVSLTALTALTVPSASPASAADPLRVLIVGDSVTQGSSGDWTWRYRLWKHLQATVGGPVEFVGPRDDLHDLLTGENGSHDYVDSGFDRDHAARWGMTLAFADTPIDELVATHEPDVVVEMLGTNDLVFLTRSPAEVEQDIENFVTAARSADPDVDVVLSEITQTWFSGAAELNALLADGAAELDSVDSRVVLADTDSGYTQVGHTFDSSHPNALGEVLIAAAVGDSLADLGIGTPPGRPLPVVPLGPRIPSVLSGSLDDRNATLSWTRSPGAATSELSMRDATAGSDWTVVADAEQGLTWSTGPLPVGHAIQFRVLPRKGWFLAQPDVASNVVTLTVPPLPGSTRVSVRTRPSGRAVITWRAASGATRYAVEMRRVGRRWRTLADDRTWTKLVRVGLRQGATYDVRVTPANSTGEGPTSKRVRFTIPLGA
jgi:lysophospholipase L1-like esterase